MTMLKFPRMHIADSAANRIRNVAAGVVADFMPTPEPTMPDPTEQGQALDQALATPAAPMAAPPMESVATASLAGDDPLLSAIEQSQEPPL